MENADIKDIKSDDGTVTIDALPVDPHAPKLGEPQTPVALALGGGAARGWAHIGVLRAFDEAGIPISMIAGTSIGALVGGCYLAGELDALEDFARSITRTSILRYMDFTFRGSGLISGTRLAARMHDRLGDMRIEDLDRKFVAVATDIRSGHEIWLHDGPLGKSISASYALPGVFKPVVLSGRSMVDGALVNPVPVSTCRAFEAEVVIAVNLNSETFGRGTIVRSSSFSEATTSGSQNDTTTGSASWLPFTRSSREQADNAHTRLGVTGIMIEAFNIIQDRITRSRLAGDPPDYTIMPKLKEIGLADFHNAAEAIQLGYEETKSRISEMASNNQLVEM